MSNPIETAKHLRLAERNPDRNSRTSSCTYPINIRACVRIEFLSSYSPNTWGRGVQIVSNHRIRKEEQACAANNKKGLATKCQPRLSVRLKSLVDRHHFT